MVLASPEFLAGNVGEKIVPRISEILLFPDHYRIFNTRNFCISYLSLLHERLNKKYPIRFFHVNTRLEEMGFYKKNSESGVSESDCIDLAVEEIAQTFSHDREAAVGAMEKLGFPLGVPGKGPGTVIALLKKMEQELQRIAKERDSESYALTLEDIPGLDRETGMDLLSTRLVKSYEPGRRGYVVTAEVKDFAASDQGPGLDGTEEAIADTDFSEKEQLRQEVDRLKEDVDSEKDQLRQEVDRLKEEGGDV